MKIVTAKTAGFCMGVKRAVDLARKAALEKGEEVYTYGPLIHNPQELSRLRNEGIIPLEESAAIPPATVVVRAHGVTPSVLRKLKEDSATLIDATCPKVEKIHEKIVEYVEKGFRVVIAGDADHPEVAGLLGYAGEGAVIVHSPEDIDALPKMGKVLLVAQTTQDEENYERIIARFKARFGEGEALRTICLSTHKRQEEVRKMAGEVDGIVVIGGKNSANTRRLYEIAMEGCKRAWHVETAADLPAEELKNLETVGVTAGASTPTWIIREVIERLKSLQP